MLSFILTCLIVEATPGPNMAYLAVISMLYGRRIGYVTVGGIGLGLFVVGVVSSLGVAAAILASSALYQFMRWAGTVYLLWLAWDSWRNEEQGGDTAHPPQAAVQYFKRGFITNILNPKAYVFYIAILPAFINTARPVLESTLVLTIIYTAIATGMHALVVTLSVMASEFLNNERKRRAVRRFLSLCLALVAIWFFVKT